jgi:hypothetical protein
MLSLDNPRWSELSHAYGSATDIPALLKELATYPPQESADSEPWSSLWSALCHQGDAYSGSYAAVPHILNIAAANPANVTFSFFSLPQAIEISRLNGKAPPIPADLELPYRRALRSVPEIAAQVLAHPVNELVLRSVLSAIAVVAGHPQLSEGISELEPRVLDRLLTEWIWV